MRILAINPGGTSIRVAVYHDNHEVWTENLVLEPSWLKENPYIKDQLEGRYTALMQLLEQKGEDPLKIDAVAARGGAIAGIQSGAYEVTEALAAKMLNEPLIDHASNLGAPIALRIKQKYGIPGYIYDSTAADELSDMTRITGLKDYPRKGRGHILNMHAVGHEAAKKLGKKLDELNLIILHLGSGISACALSHGRMIDVCPDDQGAFSPERAGLIPPYQIIEMIFDNGFDRKQAMRELTRNGGLMSLTGSTDFLALEKAAAEDERSRNIYEAMAYGCAKSIAVLSVATSGKVDAIIITGSIARSAKFTGMISERVQFIAPVMLYPGEFEMKALALGIGRVLTGEEIAKKI